ncbi:MAG: DUF1569 domain-containing protein [Terracidiphilus sp.]
MHSLRDPRDRSQILARLKRIRPETERRWGRMTAAQMICHLRDAFLGAMGERPMASPAGFSWWRLTKPFALHSPMRWPHGVPTRPEMDQVAGTGTPPAEFGADIESLVEAMEKFTTQPRGFDFRPHPLFGAMTEREWMIWGYRHADHHLRQFGA